MCLFKKPGNLFVYGTRKIRCLCFKKANNKKNKVETIGSSVNSHMQTLKITNQLPYNSTV